MLMQTLVYAEVGKNRGTYSGPQKQSARWGVPVCNCASASYRDFLVERTCGKTRLVDYDRHNGIQTSVPSAQAGSLSLG